MSVKQLLVGLSIFLVMACKPTTDSAKIKAVSNDDGSISYTVVPVRNFFDSNQTSQVTQSPISASILQSLTVAAIRCESATAKIDAVLLEMTLLSTGSSLLRKGSEIYQNHDDGARLVNRCKITGSHVGGAASIAALLTGSPSMAKQAFYLGMRGATTQDAQTASPFLYEILRENLGIRFNDAKQYAQLSKELDVLYNPCLVDRSDQYNKFSSFSCQKDGNYLAKDVNSANAAVTKFFKDSETAHIKKSSQINASASALYSQLVSVSSLDFTAMADKALQQKALGSVFSGDRQLVSDARGWATENSMTFGQADGSPAGFEHPGDGTSGWRKHGIDSYTKDGMSFYFERSPGQYQRIVHTSDNSLYEPAGQKDSPQMLKMAGSQGSVFALAGSEESSATIDPNNTPWVHEQGPVVSKTFDNYRSGKISGRQVTEELSKVTEYLPFGRKEKGDPSTRSHNCVDIAMATCRAMYRVLPEGSSVGTIGVYDPNKENTGHMVNYFSLPNKQGSRDIVAYDQQSGAMSNPQPSFQDALQDSRFAERTKKFYHDVNFKISPQSRAVLGENINPSAAKPGKMIPRQDAANYHLPGLLTGRLPDSGMDQVGSVGGTYTPREPNYMWQSMNGKSTIARIGRAFGGGWIKDGTLGKYLAPENAEWYARLTR